MFFIAGRCHIHAACGVSQVPNYLDKEIGRGIIIMTDDRNIHYPTTCPGNCPRPILLEIATSVVNEEQALASILNAECDKISKVVTACSDYETLVAIDTSVQSTLNRIISLEDILKVKLNSIIPLLNDCM